MLNIIYIILDIYIFTSIFACFANYKLKKKGLDGIKYIECFNPIKMASISVGFILKYAFPQHILEQYIIRFYDPQCRAECLLGNDGKCLSCGCDTSAKMWSPGEKDSKSRWGKIIWSKKKYTEFRKNYPLQIKIHYYGTIQEK